MGPPSLVTTVHILKIFFLKELLMQYENHLYIRWSFLLTFDSSSAVCHEYLPICAVIAHCDIIKIKNEK